MDTTIEDLVAAQQLHLAQVQNKMTQRQLRLIRAALLEILAELGTMEGGLWGVASRRATAKLLHNALANMVAGQGAALVQDLRGVTWLAKSDAATYLSTLDEHFHGSARPLRFDTLGWWEETNKDIGRVRIRTYERSFERYGAAITRGVEDAIAKNVLRGESWTNARDKVWAETRSVVKDKKWMVDRIIRTESSAAWNGTTLAALQEEDLDDDPMFKKLVAHFDNVTGRDSVILHDQTKPVEKPFYDSFHAKSYMAPPNRPNDREIVVGWRKSYGDEFDDYGDETAEDAGYDPEVHGPRVKVKGEGTGAAKEKGADPSKAQAKAEKKSEKRKDDQEKGIVPPPDDEMPIVKPKRRRPLHSKPTVRKQKEQYKNLSDERTKDVDALKKARTKLADMKRRGVDGARLSPQAERVANLIRTVDEKGVWLERLRAGY